MTDFLHRCGVCHLQHYLEGYNSRREFVLTAAKDSCPTKLVEDGVERQIKSVAVYEKWVCQQCRSKGSDVAVQ